MSHFIYHLCDVLDERVLKLTKDYNYALKLRHYNERAVSRVDEIRELLRLKPVHVERYVADHPKTKLKTAHCIAANESVNALNAWSYLHSIPNLRASLAQHIICATGTFLDPEINPPGEYRSLRLQMNSGDVEATSAVNVPDRMSELFQEVQDERYHPFEAAIYAHASIAAIQPIRNGNKRLGRFIQNAIFEQYQMPVASITPAEYDAYTHLLHTAAKGTRAWSRAPNPSRELLKPFMQYIAGKVLAKMDELATAPKQK